jgi:dTDP-glucose 4,6-dehydratase
VTRALVTGGGGSIGVHVVADLLANTDWDVTVLVRSDDETSTSWRRLRQMQSEMPEDRTFVTVAHDLRYPVGESTREDVGPVDILINLAASTDVRASVVAPERPVLNNITSALHVLEYARRLDLQVLVHVSSDEVYGPAGSETFGPDAHMEGAPHRPHNPYAASKAAIEDLCRAWWRCFDMPIVIVNTMNNFGPMQAPYKLPVLIQKWAQTGETIRLQNAGVRRWIHSAATADAIRFIIEKVTPYRHVPGEVDDLDQFNVCGDRPVQNTELVAWISGMVGGPVDVELASPTVQPDQVFGMHTYKLDGLGWSNPIPMIEGLADTVAWQAAHPEWLE